MPALIRSLRPLICALVLALAACQDAPMGPYALHRLAGGEAWVAVAVPGELPDVQDWLPLVSPETPQGMQARELVQTLMGQAALARGEGQLLRAEQLQQEAARVAAASLSQAPPAALMLRSLAAMDLWAERVRNEVQLDRATGIAGALTAVEAARTGAAAALTAGDSASAAIRVAAAAEQIRAHGPAAVALRVVGRVEQRLAEVEGKGGDPRALHLLRSARQELVDGDPRRALYRAWYALQLADGKAVPTEPAAAVGDRCSEPGCGA